MAKTLYDVLRKGFVRNISCLALDAICNSNSAVTLVVPYTYISKKSHACNADSQPFRREGSLREWEVSTPFKGDCPLLFGIQMGEVPNVSTSPTSLALPLVSYRWTGGSLFQQPYSENVQKSSGFYV